MWVEAKKEVWVEAGPSRYKKAKRAKIESPCMHGPRLEPKTGRVLDYCFTTWAIGGSGSPLLMFLGKFIFVYEKRPIFDVYQSPYQRQQKS